MNAKQYIKEIIQRACLPAAERKWLKTDLENEISSAMERGESIEQIMERMGDPDEVAAELYENFAVNPARPFREYKSKRTLFGLPLVHIIRSNYTAAVPHIRVAGARVVNIGGRYNNLSYYKLPAAHGVFAFGPKAKGIIAVGNLSAGIIAVGNLSAGIISIGNLSAGLLTIGNIALAFLFALGNIAAGLLSAGNMAFGYAAAGNMALGNFAIGNSTDGVFVFTISNLSAQFENIKMFFARLDAPAPIKAFFGIVEKFLDILNNPYPALPIIIAIASIILIAVILISIIVPYRLLKRQ